MRIPSLFWLPEIWHHIVENSDHKAAVSLMLACHHIFDLLVPAIWKNVRGVERLFALIPGALATPKSTHMTFPEALVDDDMLRFRFYAKFVIHLEPYSSIEPKQLYGNWGSLLDMSRAQPLLPNLLSINIATRWLDDSQLPMLLMFFSPSLCIFHFDRCPQFSPPVISRAATGAILDALQDKCSNLRTLHILPLTRCRLKDVSPLPLSKCRNIFELFRIRSFATGAIMLQHLGPEFTSDLERLEVDYANVTNLDPLRGARDLEFPKLKHLAVYNIDNANTYDQIWSVPARLANLKSMKLHFFNEFFQKIPLDLANILASLISHSPNVECLCLSLRINNSGLESSNSMVQLLSALPLRELRLASNYCSPARHVARSLSGKTYPSLRTLDVPTHCIRLRDLRFFAKSMPNLKFLRVSVHMPTEALSEYRGGDIRRQYVELHIYADNIGGDSTAWDPPARYLRSLWPNMQLIREHRSYVHYHWFQFE
ncbi:hypothetical protein BDV93DRAFT_548096 [Ceratobasidium sp. AG-I]|nr:hypothetical protein BDV93DRAFT_548096 [Ceratobasidium sp. AG-I]